MVDWSELPNVEFRWPKKGDRLLRKADDGAAFENDPTSRHAFAWSGFMNAGGILVDRCLSDRSASYDLIYPAMYCYRHGLELAMKWVIGQYGHYVQVEDNAPDHNLWSLWKACRSVLEGFTGDGGDTEGIEVVEQVVKDLHDLDPTGQAFRYPTNRNGMPLKLPLGEYDLAALKAVMESVDNFFSGTDGMLSDLAGSVDHHQG